MSKTILTPREVVGLLLELDAKVNNKALSEYFKAKGFASVSEHSIRAFKAHATRNS